MGDINSASYTLTDIQSRNDTIEANIVKLHDIQNDLQSQLDTGIANNTLSPDQIASINGKISSVQTIIVQLHQNSINMYGFYEQNIATTAQTLEEQGFAREIIDHEVKNTNTILQEKRDDTANKMRLIEINDYYGDQYLDRTNVMKAIILVCIPIILLSLLKNMGFVNNSIFNILIIIIIIVGVIYLGKLFIQIISHNNMQYQQYDWWFNKAAAPTVDTSTPNGTGNLSLTTCSSKPLVKKPNSSVPGMY